MEMLSNEEIEDVEDVEDETEFSHPQKQKELRESSDASKEDDFYKDRDGIPMTQSATAFVKVEIGDSLTNAILGILPQHSVDDVEAGSSSSANGRLQSVEHQQQQSQLLADPQLISSPGSLEAVSADGSAIAAGIQRHSLLGAIPIRSQQPVESQQIATPACIGGQSLLRNVPLTTVRSSNFVSHHPFEQQSHVKQQQQQHLMSNCHSEQNFAGRKRRAFHSQQLNGFEHCAIDDVETVELRLKRLKCELIEKQLMELGHQEEWRLKQEFLLGRQTAALENIVIQLRQIKEKLK
uniref:Regulatory protein zeste n=1 Tax=Globodera rostochiensis TaxID=31243 RepID=A0A914HZW9_GLORO